MMAMLLRSTVHHDNRLAGHFVVVMVVMIVVVLPDHLSRLNQRRMVPDGHHGRRSRHVRVFAARYGPSAVSEFPSVIVRRNLDGGGRSGRRPSGGCTPRILLQPGRRSVAP